MENVAAVILAAGEGKRMKSKHSKVTHKICGKSIIEWVHCAVSESGIEKSITVIGHLADQVKDCMKDKTDYAIQENQLGTGHAVMQAVDFLKSLNSKYTLVLYGDTPLITSKTLSNALNFHENNDLAVTIVTARLSDPTNYGRIIRDQNSNVIKIVECRDASEEEKKINEINSGIYCFNTEALLNALSKLSNNNAQNEYYLTDTIHILLEAGAKVGAIEANSPDEILGINDRSQLAVATEILKNRILTRHMLNGVTIMGRGTVYIDDEVVIGRDTVVYPSTILEGSTEIGEDCIIGPGTRIVNSKVSSGSTVMNSVMLDSSAGENTSIGPFAYIRPKSNIGSKVKIGDFVEIKKSTIGDGTKISHLTYVGDAKIGSHVNLGCGVVVVNYNGKDKNECVVEDNAFVGCNTNLVSPVTVEKDAYIAAGSTITENVPSGSLAIARCKQVVKEGWVEKKFKKN